MDKSWFLFKRWTTRLKAAVFLNAIEKLHKPHKW